MFDKQNTMCKTNYENMMLSLKILNKELKKKNVKRGLFDFFLILIKSINSFFLIIKYFLGKKKRKNVHNKFLSKLNFDCKDNFFSNYRIAVYTVLYGKYDNIYEPLIRPDNIDYYIFTDNNINSDSAWKQKNISFSEEITSPICKNRFLKMNPHLLFPEYDYSIYVDANIRIVGDFTAIANRIGNLGIAFHLHPVNSNVYELIDSNIIGNRDCYNSLEKHRKLLLQENMPPNLGLVEANVIARRHNEKLVISIDEQWWQEFKEYSKRDQISLHHVLWKNKVNVLDIATLGANVRENDLLYVMKHEKK